MKPNSVSRPIGVEAPVKEPGTEPAVEPQKVEPNPDLNPDRLCPAQKETITRRIRRRVINV